MTTSPTRSGAWAWCVACFAEMHRYWRQIGASMTMRAFLAAGIMVLGLGAGAAAQTEDPLPVEPDVTIADPMYQTLTVTGAQAGSGTHGIRPRSFSWGGAGGSVAHPNGPRPDRHRPEGGVHIQVCPPYCGPTPWPVSIPPMPSFPRPGVIVPPIPAFPSPPFSLGHIPPVR